MATLYDWLQSGNKQVELNVDYHKAAHSTAPSVCSHEVLGVANATLNTTPNHESSPVRGSKSNREITRDITLEQIHIAAKKSYSSLAIEAFIDGLKVFRASEHTFSSTTLKPASHYLKLRIHRILQSLDAVGDKPESVDLLAMQIADTEALAKELLTSFAKCPTKDCISASLQPYFLKAGLDENEYLHQLHATELFKDLQLCQLDSNSFESQYSTLESAIVELVDFILNSPAYYERDPCTRNEVLLRLFRSALNNPAYTLMRCDEENYAVRLLHTLAVSCWANSNNLPAYLMLGKPICDQAKISRVNSLGNLVLSARETAANAGFAEDDIDFLNKASKVLSALAKVKDIAKIGLRCLFKAGVSFRRTMDTVAEHARAYFVDEAKDYRGIYGNIPSALYDETFLTDKKNAVTLRCVISSSPAKGSSVNLEFLALLQALENRGESLFYVNLQKRFVGSEGLQSTAIMRLNERFPFSFETINLSADPLSNCDTFDDSIKNKMLEFLQSDQTYTLEHLSKKTNYYFQAKDKDAWLPVFEKIISGAYHVVEKHGDTIQAYKPQPLQVSPEDNPPKKKDNRIGVFCDLVNLGIIRYRETQKLSQMAKAGDKTTLLTSRNCAVCVDRGMMVNSQLLHLLGGKIKLTAQIEIGRGILAKKRLPLEDRVVQIATLAHNSSTSLTMRQYLSDIEKLATAGNPITTQGLSYPGCTPEMIPEDPVTPRQTRKKLFVEDDKPSSND